MDDTKLLTKKEEKDLVRLYKRANRMGRNGEIWGIYVFFCVIIAIVMGGTYSFFPEGAYRAFMTEHVWVGIVACFVLAVGYFPIYTLIQGRFSSLDEKVSKRIGESNISADEMMAVSDKFHLNKMFPYALKRRMEELNITEVPECCKDEYIPYRLPTKEDLER